MLALVEIQNILRDYRTCGSASLLLSTLSECYVSLPRLWYNEFAIIAIPWCCTLRRTRYRHELSLSGCQYVYDALNTRAVQLVSQYRYGTEYSVHILN